jgi:hypothetical protein
VRREQDDEAVEVAAVDLEEEDARVAEGRRRRRAPWGGGKP